MLIFLFGVINKQGYESKNLLIFMKYHYSFCDVNILPSDTTGLQFSTGMVWCDSTSSIVVVSKKKSFQFYFMTMNLVRKFWHNWQMYIA